MNILIVRLSSIGDIIHTLPAVPLLKKHAPEHTLTWVADMPGAELITGYQGIDRVIVFPGDEMRRGGFRTRIARGGRTLVHFMQRLRQQRYDIVLDFQGLLKSGLIVLASRSTYTIGFANAREGAWLFYDQRVPAPDVNAHAIQRNLALLTGLGIDPQPVLFSPLFNDRDTRALVQAGNEAHLNGKLPVVCVHPFSRWRTKCWPLERFAALCERLVRHLRCEVVLIGGQHERLSAEMLVRQCGIPVRNLVGMLSLRMTASLLHHAALLVSPDSGPVHLACAVGTPVVALFGPTAPWRTGPFGSGNHVIRKALPCSPCYRRRTCPSGHHRCMEDISVAEVCEVCCNYFHSMTQPSFFERLGYGYQQGTA